MICRNSCPSRAFFLVILVYYFTENKIDFEAFMLLEETDFVELVPKIGLRRKIIKRWKDVGLSVPTYTSINSTAQPTVS